MTPTEAYYFAMNKVKELIDNGIEVTTKESRSSKDERVIKKYKLPERIPANLWHHLTFKLENQEQTNMLSETANYLGMCGISFDTGGCCGTRDWEFDWSFKYIKGDENCEWREAREDVEDMIDQMTK